MRLSRAVSWVVVQSLILAVVIKLGVVMLVYTGWGRLWLAVASDGASLVAVMLNGSRPLFFCAEGVYLSIAALTVGHSTEMCLRDLVGMIDL
jgi:hypothetical protein